MASQEGGSPAKLGFGSASMNSVRSFLKGRSLPGTVRMSRTERSAPQQPTAAAAPQQQGATDASDQQPPADGSAQAADTALASAAHSDFSAGSAPPSRTTSSASQQAREGRSTAAAASAGAAPAAANTDSSPAAEAGSSPAADEQQSAAAPPPPPPKAPESRSMYAARLEKFGRILGERVVDLDVLRELAWSGVPPQFRADCWRLLLGYLPPSHDRREALLARKRREYRDYLPQFYDVAPGERTDDETTALRQVAVDVPRTAPEVAFFHQAPVQKSLERILYIWGVRHPASGYVQGINDLVTPFLAVFLAEHFSREASMDSWDLSLLSEEAMLEVEADSYWCLCKLLDGIQDHYTYAQPGIQRTVFHLKELVRRIDEPVAQHLDEECVDFLQFSFRWINCLLIREVPFSLAQRLWDTYLSETGRLKDFLVYVAAAFLLSWSGPLRTMDFQEIVLFLQKPSTSEWGEHDIESMLARAYLWRASFGDARSHLTER